MSRKEPINPILDVSFKNFIERKAAELDMSQSGFLSKLIDAFRLYHNSISGTDKQVDESDRRLAVKGLNSAYAQMYLEREEKEVLDLKKRKKARRFYVSTAQKEWLKDQIGISDTIKVVLAFYIEGKLDKYLAGEVKRGKETAKSREFQPLPEEDEDDDG
ncbi:hypothetical protein KGY71_01350 [Candidatus Bipolaricaulota bacterium]|nr:hypothetical protein [Candidatus Bipolaricaulota bacterium]